MNGGGSIQVAKRSSEPREGKLFILPGGIREGFTEKLMCVLGLEEGVRLVLGKDSFLEQAR